MNKIYLILIGMFLIGLVSATVYSTPGFVNESNEVSPEVSLLVDAPINFTEFQEDSTDKDFPIWIVFIALVTMAAIYVQRKYILKKRKEKKEELKGLVPNFVNNALENMEKAKDISKTPEEFNELVSELGLEDVVDKMEEKSKEEKK